MPKEKADNADGKATTFAHMLNEGTSSEQYKGDPAKADKSTEGAPKQSDKPKSEDLPPSGSSGNEKAAQEPTPQDGERNVAGAQDQKKYRFKTQEEAEKAYEEAQRLMTRATTRAKEIERQLMDAQKHLEEDDQKALAKLTEEATNKIRGLDNDDPDIEAKQLTILTDLQAKIAARATESTAKRVISEQIKAREEAQAANRRIHELLSEQKLDTPEHFELFHHLLVRVMDERPDFDELPDSEQFNLVFNRMKPLIGLTEERLQEISNQNNAAKNAASPMGRGGTSQPLGTAPSEPTTLTQQLRALREDTGRAYRG